MGTAALKPSLFVGRLLRKKRQDLKLSLREVSEQMEAKGDRIPTSTLARIELGKLDPGVRRLHLLLNLYDIPPHLVADLVELETLAVAPPVQKDLETLYREGVEHWRKGNVQEGLAYLMAVRSNVPADDESKLLRQKATLTFAMQARNLGKIQLAKQITDDLLCEPPDSTIMVHTLLLVSSIWRAIGSHEMALATAQHAVRELVTTDDPVSANAFHQLATTLVDEDRFDEAEKALRKAFRGFRKHGDTYNEARAMTVRAKILEKRGDLPASIRCLRQLLLFCEKHDRQRVRLYANIEMSRLYNDIGEPRKGLERIRPALDSAVSIADRNAEFLCHFHAWKAYEALEETDRARFEREAARYFVQFVDDKSLQADEVRALPDHPDRSKNR